MLIHWLRPLYTEDDGAPHGGDAGDKQRPTDILDRYGRDALKLAEKLSEALTDNYSLREKNRALRADKTTLEKNQAPEGAVILTGADVETWNAYKGLGAPDVVKTTLEQAQAASQEAATLRREKMLTEAATAHSYKPAVLARLAGDLDISIKPDKDKKPIAYVVKDGKETRLDAYAEQEWGDFLPSLTAEQRREAPDINAGARSGSHSTAPTEEERARITRRYQSTF